jgi:hypothetical protein
MDLETVLTARVHADLRYPTLAELGPADRLGSLTFLIADYKTEGNDLLDLLFGLQPFDGLGAFVLNPSVSVDEAVAEFTETPDPGAGTVYGTYNAATKEFTPA